ncbi:hypothetical protein MPSEU_000820200 [Mayamaea pseudoterrestris]|nr:hypothetical protein MPSEU_000820200 [Mayamaea pseudoterrestris]
MTISFLQKPLSLSLLRFVLTLFILSRAETEARMREVMNSTSDGDTNVDEKPYCPCRLLAKPDIWDKALTARWMVHSLEWGVLSTISSRLFAEDAQKIQLAMPFGNVYSFVDGSCDNSTGVPYFYGTYMDQSFRDIQKHPYASFTLSEASLATVCGGGLILAACDASTQTKGYYGDAESPVCARLTLSGRMVEVEQASDEFKWAQNALFQRHPDMEGWPSNHDWIVAKLELKDVWLIDYFGGASIIKVDDYLNTQLLDQDYVDSH